MPKFDARQRERSRGEKRKQRKHGRGERKRDNVVMVRVDEVNLNRIDELVDSGQFNSRSEATAFLIGEGIRSKQQMFDKMAEKISQIQELRTELEAMIAEDTKSTQPNKQEIDETPDNGGESQCENR